MNTKRNDRRVSTLEEQAFGCIMAIVGLAIGGALTWITGMWDWLAR